LNRIVRRAAAWIGINGGDAGIELTTHGLRDTFTTNLEKAKCDPFVLKRLRGDTVEADPVLQIIGTYTSYTHAELLREYLRLYPRIGITPRA
jgi:integrase